MQYYGGQLADQRTDQNGAPYATDSLDNLLQREVFDIREGGTDDWRLASLALTYAAPFWQLRIFDVGVGQTNL